MYYAQVPFSRHIFVCTVPQFGTLVYPLCTEYLVRVKNAEIIIFYYFLAGYITLLLYQNLQIRYVLQYVTNSVFVDSKLPSRRRRFQCASRTASNRISFPRTNIVFKCFQLYALFTIKQNITRYSAWLHEVYVGWVYLTLTAICIATSRYGNNFHEIASENCKNQKVCIFYETLTCAVLSCYKYYF